MQVFVAIGSQALDDNNDLPLSDGRYKLKEARYHIEVKGGKVVQVEAEGEKFVQIVAVIIIALIAVVIYFSLST
jgi:major membrane immunogen (membrane-anchored lipoprotein)